MENELGNDDRPIETVQPSPPPRRVWPVFIGFMLVLGGVLFGGAVLAVVLVLVQEGRLPDSTRELESQLSAIVVTPPALIASILLSVSLLLSISLIGATLSPQPLSERLRLHRRALPFLAYPVAIVGLLVIGQSLEYMAVWLGLRDGSSALDVIVDAVAGMPPPAFVAFLIAGSLGAGVAEELFFRGYMQTRLTRRFGVVAGLIMSSLAFGILHLDPVHAALAFFMGVYLGWLAELTGSLVLPMVAHVGNNFIAFMMMRSFASTIEAPVAYFAVSATLAVGCVLVLKRVVSRSAGLAHR